MEMPTKTTIALLQSSPKPVCISLVIVNEVLQKTEDI